MTHPTPRTRLRAKLHAATTDDRGLSLIELLIAVILTGIVAAAAIAALATVQNRVNDTTASAIAQQDARELFDRTTSQLRSAVPLGACANPPAATSDIECLQVTTLAAKEPLDAAGDPNTAAYAFPEASSHHLCFHAFPRALDGASSTQGLAVPRKHCIDTVADNLVLYTYEPNQTTNYTQPTSYADDPDETFTLGRVTNPDTTPIFTYYDSDGNEMPSPVTGEDLRRIATIEFTPHIAFTALGRPDAAEKRQITISVRSQRFSEERDWVQERFGGTS